MPFNETKTIPIHALGPKGDGIHERSRGPIYVERTLPGDRVEVRLRQESSGVVRGDLLKVLTPSPDRREAPCAHYERCGNCSIQHASEAFYRNWKLEIVRDAFRRQGVHPLKWLDPVFLGGGNRRRASFSAIMLGPRLVIGYNRRRSRQITTVDSCLVASERLMEVRELLRFFLSKVMAEDSSLDVFVQIIGKSIDLVLIGPVGRFGEPDDEVREIAEEWMAKSPVTRLGWRPFPEEERIETLVDKGPLTAKFGSLKVDLPQGAFLQPTAVGEQTLTKAVMAAMPTEGKFADLFSGCGTFSGSLLDRGSVDAYELSIDAVTALGKAAGDRPLKAIQRDLFKNPLKASELTEYNGIVFDPPRGGCPEQAVELAQAKAEVIVGVSCNPATFARDARLLGVGGYRLQSVQVVDQFLWSHHVEVVGVFGRKKTRPRPDPKAKSESVSAPTATPPSET